MTSRQDRRAGRTQRDEVEDILALVPGATAAEADALVALFAGATGPIRPGELPGEAAAVAVFRATQPVPAVVSRTSRARAAALTVKTAIAALALTSVGGVALAATTDVLPAPLTIGHSPEKLRDSRGSTGNTDGDADGDATGTIAVRDAAKAAAAQDRADAKAGREASYAGQCRAFNAGARNNGKAAENPAFARLVAAAPGGNVAAFCSALTAETPAAGNAPSKGKSAEAHERADNGKPDAKPVKAPGKASDKSQRAADKVPGDNKAPAKAKAAEMKADAQRDGAAKPPRDQRST